MISFIWYMIALVCVVVIAGVGMDFSPSFTAMFLVVFLVLAVLGELCGYYGKKQDSRTLLFMGRFFLIVGAFLVFASTYIYANGDDWLKLSACIAPAAAVVLHLAVYLFFYKREGWVMGVDAGIENCLLLAAGLFTLACAVPSTALWPYGLGVLLILTARRLGSAGADMRLSKGAMVTGMLLCAAFLVAPMVF